MFLRHAADGTIQNMIFGSTFALGKGVPPATQTSLNSDLKLRVLEDLGEITIEYPDSPEEDTTGWWELQACAEVVPHLW
jgi:hypothetical protein